MDLKVGINEIEIPAVSSLGVEKGGALYVEYTGNNPNDEYGVRVIGGSQYPVLDVTRAKTEEERRELIDAYVEEMIEYVPKIEALHNADQDNENPTMRFQRMNTRRKTVSWEQRILCWIR